MLENQVNTIHLKISGGNAMNYICNYQSPLGEMSLVSDGECLTGLWFDGQKYVSDALSETYHKKPLSVFEQTKQWLDCYFNGQELKFKIPLLLNGTQFRKSVWEILLKIPYGETITYGDIAKELAKNNRIAHMSAQAVGGAVGHNPVAIIVPCHRVVGSNGSLTGYAGGIDRKIELLKLEKVNIEKMYIPNNGTAL